LCKIMDDKFTVLQLKETLRRLGLPHKGNKPELLKRLYEFDPSGEWKQNAGKILMDETMPEAEEATTYAPTEGSESEMDEEERPRRRRSRRKVQEEESLLRDRELELLRRERELMQQEIALLRREVNAESNVRVMTSSISSQASTTRPQPKAMSELLSEFSGAEDTFWTWRKQFDLIRETYQLDDGIARILISMRLKQKALQWFHSRPEHLEITVDELIERMRSIFDHRPAKMDLRKKFEKRVWHGDETFSNYFYDKTILAYRVPVDEDELTDFIIDGIPDKIIQDQARMQNFTRKEDLLRAFEKITFHTTNKNSARVSNHTIVNKTNLNRVTRSQPQEATGQSSAEVRCYNCSQTGHIARNCGKPRRERGSCYECEATDHRLRDCPRRKRATREPTRTDTAAQISNVVEEQQSNNEYRKAITLQIGKGELIDDQKCETQLDTASPISLIKAKFVPLILVSKTADSRTKE